MRIKKVKWKDHPILGSLELDFYNSSTGKLYNNIIFAGENGTGKTTILESLSTFLNVGSFEFFDYIEYIIDGKTIKIIEDERENYSINGYHKRVDGDTITSITVHRSNIDKLDSLDIRYYGCVFSKARADYKTDKIKSTTTKELDNEKYDNDSDDNFTSLKQLIVDIYSQDTVSYSELNQSRGSNPLSWDDFYESSKIYRFKEAFNDFFEKIEFKKIDDKDGEKTILFNKNSNLISIDHLSTGEKQVVFRGIYLLKNNTNLVGSVCMIDEPELSMHPKWQQKIFQYYTNLFKKQSVQNAQLLFATHSTDVLKSALKDNDNSLVIVLKEDNGVINSNRVDAPSVLPTITNAETNYLAFDVISNDYHIELYGHLQNTINETKVKQTDDYIKNHADYNSSLHYKSSSNPHGTTYDTLPTYIRNAIDHPSPSMQFTDDELEKSIKLLIKIC